MKTLIKITSLYKDAKGRYCCKECGNNHIFTQLNRKYVYHKCSKCGAEYSN